MTLVLRGAGHLTDTTPLSGGAFSSLPVPSGSQVGDLVVIAFPPTGSTSYSLNPDARISAAGDNAWIGTLTHLGDFALSSANPDGSHWQAVIATFAPRSIPEAERWSIQTSADAGTLGTVNAPEAIVVGVSSHSVVSGAILVDPPAQPAGSPPTGIVAARIYTLDYPSSPSPALGWTAGGGSGDRWITVIGIGGTGAPPCRLYPRADHLGIGSGRIWPPASTRQAGRLNGPY